MPLEIVDKETINLPGGVQAKTLQTTAALPSGQHIKVWQEPDRPTGTRPFHWRVLMGAQEVHECSCQLNGVAATYEAACEAAQAAEEAHSHDG